MDRLNRNFMPHTKAPSAEPNIWNYPAVWQKNLARGQAALRTRTGPAERLLGGRGRGSAVGGTHTHKYMLLQSRRITNHLYIMTQTQVFAPQHEPDLMFIPSPLGCGGWVGLYVPARCPFAAEKNTQS